MRLLNHLSIYPFSILYPHFVITPSPKQFSRSSRFTFQTTHYFLLVFVYTARVCVVSIQRKVIFVHTSLQCFSFMRTVSSSFSLSLFSFFSLAFNPTLLKEKNFPPLFRYSWSHHFHFFWSFRLIISSLVISESLPRFPVCRVCCRSYSRSLSSLWSHVPSSSSLSLASLIRLRPSLSFCYFFDSI